MVSSFIVQLAREECAYGGLVARICLGMPQKSQTGRRTPTRFGMVGLHVVTLGTESDSCPAKKKAAAAAALAAKTTTTLGVDSPFFSTIILFKNRLFPLGS